MRIPGTIEPPSLPYSSLRLDLSEDEAALRDAVHQFSRDLVRPKCAEMERLTAEEVAATGSPWWELFAAIFDLGLDIEGIYLGDPIRGNRKKAILFEELGWGDGGVAVGAMVAMFPNVMARQLGRDDLVAMTVGKIGCWIATQPDRGSDAADVEGTELAHGTQHQPGSMYAVETNSGVRLHGASSQWVSLGAVAQVALAYFPLRETDGTPRFNRDGRSEGIGALVDLSQEGVTQGPALAKMGQKPLPQGRIAFDNVEVPKEHIVAGPDQYVNSMLAALIEGNQTMAAIWTGAGRAAYELALDHANNRVQGGVPIAQHQLVKWRLFRTFQDLAAARALTFDAFDHNARAKEPHVIAGISAKTFATRAAMQAASEAMSICGASGLVEGSLAEKIFRDAQASLVEDGENHLLELKGGTYLNEQWSG